MNCQPVHIPELYHLPMCIILQLIDQRRKFFPHGIQLRPELFQGFLREEKHHRTISSLISRP